MEEFMNDTRLAPPREDSVTEGAQRGVHEPPYFPASPLQRELKTGPGK